MSKASRLGTYGSPYGGQVGPPKNATYMSMHYYTPGWSRYDPIGYRLSQGGIVGHNSKAAPSAAIGLIEEALSDYKWLDKVPSRDVRRNRRNKSKKLAPQTRIMPGEQESVVGINNAGKVYIKLGARWAKEIYRARLPLVKYAKGNLSILVGAKRLDDIDNIQIFEVEVCQIVKGKDEKPFMVNNLTMFLATDVLSNGKKMRRLNVLAEDSVDQIKCKQEELMLKAMGIEAEEEEE